MLVAHGDNQGDDVHEGKATQLASLLLPPTTSNSAWHPCTLWGAQRLENELIRTWVAVVSHTRHHCSSFIESLASLCVVLLKPIILAVVCGFGNPHRMQPIVEREKRTSEWLQLLMCSFNCGQVLKCYDWCFQERRIPAQSMQRNLIRLVRP